MSFTSRYVTMMFRRGLKMFYLWKAMIVRGGRGLSSDTAGIQLVYREERGVRAGSE